ncbi:MAG: patatin-like phospholipase family protein [Candidatus Woesearchaeota archaeon]
MKNFALVLGGGGAKTFSHLGVFDALKENNLKPELLVTSSMGSLFGYFIANEIDTGTIKEKFYSKLNRIRLMRPTTKKGGIISQTHIKRIIDSLCDEKIENTKIRLIITATDIVNGKLVLLKEGDPKKAILASSAYPGIYPPIESENTLLVDSGVLNNVPADIAKREIKSGKVLSINLDGKWDKNIEHYNRSTGMIHKAVYLPIVLRREEICEKYSDFTIRPYDDTIFSFGSWFEIFSFYRANKMEEFYQRGYDYTKDHIEDIKRALKD